MSVEVKELKRGLMVQRRTLNNPRDFFEEVTRPNYEDFLSSPSSFKTAFGLAMSLFNLHEWLFEFNRAEMEREFDKSFSKSRDLWLEVERRIPDAKFLRDLTNASKHVKLTLKPSTLMTDISDAEERESLYGDGDYGVGRYSAPYIVINNRGSDVYLDDCAKSVFDFWEILLDDLYPNP